MTPPTRRRLLAGAGAWALALVVLARLSASTVPGALRPGATLDDVLGALAATLGVAILAWFGVVTACSAAVLLGPGTSHAGRAGRWAARLAPATVRRLVTAALAAALFGGPAAPASAAQPRAAVAAVLVTGVRADAPHASPALDPSWPVALPAEASSEPTGSLDPTWGSPDRRRPGVVTDEAVTVHRGDTLWDIAARHLGASATDAEIASSWPGWYAANRDVIGPDPDRLRPGQRLRPPGAPGGRP